MRLTGLAIKAENNSDEALSGLEGAVKPDAKKVDLKLEVKVDMVPADGEHGAERLEVQENGAIPRTRSSHSFFPSRPRHRTNRRASRSTISLPLMVA